MIRKEIKQRYINFKKDFKELEKYFIEYDNRFYSRIVLRNNGQINLLCQNCMIFLLKSLTRSHCLYLGFIECINRKQLAIAFLAARAHFETTGLIAYFLKYLRKFYNKEISYKEIDDKLFKLSLGGKTFPEKNDRPDRPDAINVLTLIDEADNMFTEMGGQVKPFRDCYDYLSEFCHPNYLGLTIGSELKGMDSIDFFNIPEFKEEDFGTMLNNMIMSCAFFFYLYDSCFTLIKNNEVMPILIK